VPKLSREDLDQAIGAVALLPVSARNDCQGSGICSAGIPEILGSKIRQQVPVRGRRRSIFSEIAALGFGEFTTQRVFLGESGFLEAMCGVGQLGRTSVPLPLLTGVDYYVM
jgi:hypothetical protein